MVTNMNATHTLHALGQSLWLDNITRKLLKTGLLRRYIDELSLTGLTSNPTIFAHAFRNSGDYDDAIKSKVAEGKSEEQVFLEIMLDDITQAADLFRLYDRTCGVDGWGGIRGLAFTSAQHQIDDCSGKGPAHTCAAP